MEDVKRPRVVAAPDAPKVTWRANELRRASRVSSIFSLAMSAGLLAIVGVNLLLGDRSLFTLLALVLSLFLIDGAVTRLLAASRAPLQVGLSAAALHIRTRKGEEAFAWPSVTDVRFSSVPPRPDTLTITQSNGNVTSFQGVLPAIAMEVKLAWLEASARDRGARKAQERAVPGGPLRAGEVWNELLPTAAPQYWTPSGLAPPKGSQGPSVVVAVDGKDLAAARPAWGYTRGSSGAAEPDPRYGAEPRGARPFVWHFIPGAGTRFGGLFLFVVLVLAGIAVTRLAADAGLSVAGLHSDPWVTDLIGVGAGAAVAAAVWRLSKGELVGEVAGSVIFLPAFDRTKGEIVATLRDAGAALQVGEPRERRSRGKLTVQWPSAHTRATILQASPETRAIVLKTVGRANFDLHARLKGAILEKLRGPGLRK